ncbi:MAG: glycosyltransferase family 2 protein, partial [Desulfatibacillaceae bacterium]|nr:glycosyltransferase family 2 protein [Desulfatibacillaceae bacterium]
VFAGGSSAMNNGLFEKTERKVPCKTSNSPGIGIQYDLSIVIPVYNGALFLEATLCTVLKFMETLPLAFELIVVNDGSTDSTPEILSRLEARFPQIRVIGYPINRGKGYAVRQGMLAAKSGFILFMDCDLAVPLDFLPSVIDELQKGADIAIGSRHLPGAAIAMPQGRLRAFLGEIFRQMAINVFCLPVSDITCGLKGFSFQAADSVFSLARINRWSFDLEILFLAKKLGLNIKEIPVVWNHRQGSTVRPIRDALVCLVDMLRITYWNLKNEYKAGNG